MIEILLQLREFVNIQYTITNIGTPTVIALFSIQTLLPSSGQLVVSAVLPSVFFGFVKSEVWRILVNSYKMIFPVFTSPELLSTALYQTLVLKDMKEVSGKSFKALVFTLKACLQIFPLI